MSRLNSTDHLWIKVGRVPGDADRHERVDSRNAPWPVRLPWHGSGGRRLFCLQYEEGIRAITHLCPVLPGC
jgi:hypothetical protein